jgi:hypothetical protein
MNSVFFDSRLGDDARRERLYAGQLFVYAPVPSALALVDLARGLVQEAFGARDPELAQHDMPVEEYAALLAALKPKFIHHPRAKECLQGSCAQRWMRPDEGVLRRAPDAHGDE